MIEAETRPLRRVLSVTAWVVLEEVALGAEPSGDGRLLAATSAREVAAGLAIDTGTAAGALRQLRRRGILALERQPGPGGRFGLSVYSLATPPGLVVLHPCGALPTWRSLTRHLLTDTFDEDGGDTLDEDETAIWCSSEVSLPCSDWRRC